MNDTRTMHALLDMAMDELVAGRDWRLMLRREPAGDRLVPLLEAAERLRDSSPPPAHSWPQRRERLWRRVRHAIGLFTVSTVPGPGRFHLAVPSGRPSLRADDGSHAIRRWATGKESIP